MMAYSQASHMIWLRTRTVRFAGALLAFGIIVGFAGLSLASSASGNIDVNAIASSTVVSTSTVYLNSTSINETTTSTFTEHTQNILFGVRAVPLQESNTSVIPSDTLVWSTYSVSNSVFVLGAQTQIRVMPENYGSNLSLAVYLDGNLLSSQTYTIQKPMPPPSHNGSSIPSNATIQAAFSLPISTNVSSGSHLSLAIFCQSPVTIYTSNSTSSSRSSIIASVPSELPSPLSNASYAPDIFAYSIEG